MAQFVLAISNLQKGRYTILENGRISVKFAATETSDCLQFAQYLEKLFIELRLSPPT